MSAFAKAKFPKIFYMFSNSISNNECYSFIGTGYLFGSFVECIIIFFKIHKDLRTMQRYIVTLKQSPKLNTYVEKLFVISRKIFEIFHQFCFNAFNFFIHKLPHFVNAFIKYVIAVNQQKFR